MTTGGTGGTWTSSPPDCCAGESGCGEYFEPVPADGSAGGNTQCRCDKGMEFRSFCSGADAACASHGAQAPCNGESGCQWGVAKRRI